MENSLRAIAQAKEDGETVQCYIRDLNTWENEMKQKEAALKEEQAQQALPPVRTRQRRDKYRKKNNRKRPAATDQAWEVFDPNKSYEDMEDVGPLSLTLDWKQSEIIKQMQVKEEAQYQKERGNKFVKVERWDDAIACYNRAIQLVKDDAIYYANRGLCYLKKDSLHQAEQDCTEALRLDPKYVKALQRRATARERLGSLRAASADLTEVMKLEPHNVAAKRQLESIKQRMGTKGRMDPATRKAKSSPLVKPSAAATSADLATKLSTPMVPKPTPQGPQSTVESHDASQNGPPRPILEQNLSEVPPGKIFGVPQASQIELDIQPTPIKKVEVTNGTNLVNWKDGIGENVLVIKPVKKPPHLRSKRALKTIPIREIPLGKTIEDLEKPPTRMKIIEIDQSQGDTNNNDEIGRDTIIKKTKEIIENLLKNDTTPVKSKETIAKFLNNGTKLEKPKETIENFLNNVTKLEKPKETIEKFLNNGTKLGKPKETIEKFLNNDTTLEKPKETVESSFNNDTTVAKRKETTENFLNNDVVNEVQKNDVNENFKIESNEVQKNDLKKNDVNENFKIESNLLKVSKSDVVAPTNSVQFMAGWRNLRGDDKARCDYLSLLEPSNIPKVFANALESAVLSEIIQVLYNYKGALRPRVKDYLKGLACVKRLSALVMFLSANDKEVLNKLLVHCKTTEDCSDEDITELKNKYEL